MLYLAATLLLLFTAWVFYGWIVAESFQIRWLKHYCAGLFIILLMLICLGGGIGLTRQFLVSTHRATVQQLAGDLHQRLKDGRHTEVHAAIRFLAETPQEGTDTSGDVLQRVHQLRAAMESATASGRTLALEPEGKQTY
jgi:hypothetical protein